MLLLNLIRLEISKCSVKYSHSSTNLQVRIVSDIQIAPSFSECQSTGGESIVNFLYFPTRMVNSFAQKEVISKT